MKRKIAWISLVSLAICIKILSWFPWAVERYYSDGLYPVIARLQRVLFGWIPFSAGDIFYGIVVIWLLISLFRLVRRIVRKEAGHGYLWTVARRLIFSLLLIYVAFNLAWGLNYDRKGIADQMQLQVRPYSNSELKDLVGIIVDRLNELDSAAMEHRAALSGNRNLLEGAIGSYRNLAARDPRFAYPSPSIKPSVYSLLGNYLGISGYYNPFSGEAQVNTLTPPFTRPFTACHEIGHQLGYAKENEANFAGYLSAHSSDDPAFRYSVYFDLYYYAARELYVRDSTLLVPLRESLRPSIRRDFRELREFYRRYENPFEPVIRHLYGGYLKANSQPQGMMTYDDVIAWMIAYIRKVGRENI